MNHIELTNKFLILSYSQTLGICLMCLQCILSGNLIQVGSEITRLFIEGGQLCDAKDGISTVMLVLLLWQHHG